MCYKGICALQMKRVRLLLCLENQFLSILEEYHNTKNE